MKKYVCEICGYAGTPFEKLPDDWTCPDCGVGKDDFKPEDEKK